MNYEEKITVFRLDAQNARQVFRKGTPNIVHHWVLCVGEQGTATIIINQVTTTVRRNSIFILMPKQVLTLEEHSDDIKITFIQMPTEITLYLSGKERDVFFADTHFQSLNSVLLNSLLCISDTDARLGHQLEEADAEDIRKITSILETRSAKRNKMTLSLQLSLIDCIIQILTSSTEKVSNTAEKLPRHSSLVKKFFTELVINSREHHDVAYYAERLGLSSKYLSTLVKQETGVAALTWINRIVLYEAKKLLKTTDKTINEIAEILHFNSPSSFIRFFKTQSGVTPHVYRR